MSYKKVVWFLLLALLLFPTALLAIRAATIQIGSQPSDPGAIDTLTVSGDDGTVAASPATGMIIDTAQAGDTPNSVVIRFVAKGAGLAPFTIQNLGSGCYRVAAPANPAAQINSARLAGQLIFPDGMALSHAGKVHTLLRFEPVPGLGWYALGLLALLMAISVWWFLRRKPVPSAG